MQKYHKINLNRRCFLLVFLISFSVFVFSSDGHRYTFDEGIAQDQSIRIATMQPHPNYVQGESRIFFEYTWLYPPSANPRSICENAILCSQASVIHSLTQTPFLILNQNLHIITNEIKEISPYDYDDQSYALWRNSLNPNFTFMELFYGPFFSALSVSTLFLVSRTFNFSIKTSLLLSFLFGFSTILWAYSQTSLNSVLSTFFILLGFLFFRNFQNTSSHYHLVLSSIIFGLAFLTRQDSILFIIPLFFFMLYELRNKNKKIKHFFSFIIPLTSSYGISLLIDYVRVGLVNSSAPLTYASYVGGQGMIPVHLNMFGLLFSPGVGLMIFAPILITIFFSFPHFYKNHKPECILFASVVGFFLLFYGSSGTWHGLNAWGPRYLVPIIPFLILPLGSSIEKIKHISFKISITFLAILGAFFNLLYLIQDVSWFIWGILGSRKGGLYDIGDAANLWVSPLVLWTFEFSQLTHSFVWASTRLQPDILLLHILGIGLYVLILGIVLIPLIFLLTRFLKNNFQISENMQEND
ncbi:Alg9-like mannosyltransferase protein [Marine Group I thaumarchaeote SCGC AAA799-P11]|uniref:Alg9-like mannosyltransferase protein n=1 Tax=Marine Group I thaumarchaeote SCGC AAA799-P11 TaxID=1502295 RepID=A0A087S2X9_9ARCH|nr:Alg9-like mannosyltransferase protein [Marine Group I thaumarchaeote SCGC AAA799-P11]